MPFITTEDGNRVRIPTHIMKKWRFRAIVDTETETVGGFCLNRRVRDGVPIRGVTFTEPEIMVNRTRRAVTDELLDSVAFPHHILTLGYITKKTLEKEPGETFTHREVLDALLEMDNDDRVQSRDVDHIYFEGLSYNTQHGLYAPTWGS